MMRDTNKLSGHMTHALLLVSKDGGPNLCRCLREAKIIEGTGGIVHAHSYTVVLLHNGHRVSIAQLAAST